MISQRRAAAARANGARSRGPVTARGKAASSRNSLRHGLYAKKSFPSTPDSRDQFTELLASFREDLSPRTPGEDRLVTAMAAASCHIQCVWELEARILNEETRKQMFLAAAAGDPVDPNTGLALAFKALSDNSQIFDLLNRCEGRFDRQFRRALDRFHELRSTAATLPSISAEISTFSETFDLSSPAPDVFQLPESSSPAPQPWQPLKSPSPAPGSAEKINIAERTQQVIENTETPDEILIPSKHFVRTRSHQLPAKHLPNARTTIEWARRYRHRPDAARTPVVPPAS